MNSRESRVTRPATRWKGAALVLDEMFGLNNLYQIFGIKYSAKISQGWLPAQAHEAFVAGTSRLASLGFINPKKKFRRQEL